MFVYLQEIEEIKFSFDRLRPIMNQTDFLAFENAPITQWPLIIELIKERTAYENRLNDECDRVDMARKMQQMYRDIIAKQQQILFEMEAPDS